MSILAEQIETSPAPWWTRYLGRLTLASRARWLRDSGKCFVCGTCADKTGTPPAVLLQWPGIWVHLGDCRELVYREGRTFEKTARGRRRRRLDILARIEGARQPSNGHTEGNALEAVMTTSEQAP
jgi:hypothetical protein